MAKWKILCKTGQFVFKVPSEFNGKDIYYNTKKKHIKKIIIKKITLR